MSIKLGDRVTDIVSGIKGVAWAKVSYLTSPDQIGMMVAEEGKLPDVYYVDEDRLMAQSLKELQDLKYGGSTE